MAAMNLSWAYGTRRHKPESCTTRNTANYRQRKYGRGVRMPRDLVGVKRSQTITALMLKCRLAFSETRKPTHFSIPARQYSSVNSGCRCATPGASRARTRTELSVSSHTATMKPQFLMSMSAFRTRSCGYLGMGRFCRLKLPI